MLRTWARELKRAGARRQAQRTVRRECGRCSVCCTVKSIDELAKPVGVPCPHLVDGGCGGCGRYTTRPQECAWYYCAWRLGFGPERGRPDASTASVLIDLEHKPDLDPLRPFHVSTFVAIVRATGPFVLEPVLAMALELASVGIQYFGCIDRLTRPHAPFVLTRTRAAWLMMIRYFATTGLAPWNRDEDAMERLGANALRSEDAPAHTPALAAQVPDPEADRKG